MAVVNVVVSSASQCVYDLVNDWNLCKTFSWSVPIFKWLFYFILTLNDEEIEMLVIQSGMIHDTRCNIAFCLLYRCWLLFFLLLFFFRMVSTKEAKELFGFRYYVVHINPLFHRLSLCVCWSPLIFCSFSLFSLSVCRLLLLNLCFFSYVSLMLNAHFTNGFSVAIFASR